MIAKIDLNENKMRKKSGWSIKTRTKEGGAVEEVESEERDMSGGVRQASHQDTERRSTEGGARTTEEERILGGIQKSVT